MDLARPAIYATLQYAKFAVNHTQEELLLNYMIVQMATDIATKKS